jgi:hypothetical protein
LLITTDNRYLSEPSLNMQTDIVYAAHIVHLSTRLALRNLKLGSTNINQEPGERGARLARDT